MGKIVTSSPSRTSFRSDGLTFRARSARASKSVTSVASVCVAASSVPKRTANEKKAKPSRPDIYPWIAASFPFFLLRAFFSPWLAGLQSVGDATASATENSNQEWKMDRFVSARKLTMQAMVCSPLGRGR